MLIAQFVAVLSITEFLLRLNPRVPGEAIPELGDRVFGERYDYLGHRDGSAGEGDCGLDVLSEFNPWDPQGGRQTHSCTCTPSPQIIFF